MPTSDQDREILRSEDTTFTDDDPVAAAPSGRKFAADLDRWFRNVRKLRLLIPYQRRLQAQRALKLILVVDLDQHIHAEPNGRVFKIARQRIIDRRHDQEDAVSTEARALPAT